MDEVTNIVKKLAAGADEVTRKQIILQLRDLAYSVEKPDDTLDRIMFLPLQLAIIRIGVDLQIFTLLTSHSEPMTLSALQLATGADSILLARLLRYLSSIGTILESTPGSFTATNITTSLSDAGNQAGIRHYFDHVSPQFLILPSFLSKNGYQNIVDGRKTVFQEAWNTELSVFEWLPKVRPEHFDNLNKHMAARRARMTSWLSVFPFLDKVSVGNGEEEERVVFVDIGGGIGHQCRELRDKYPGVGGRVVLQDLPYSIARALPTDGVEKMANDFFEGQPVVGAKIYYMRGILHDFPDDKCRIILKNIVQAMGKESMILIDEMVLPEYHVHWQATQVDLTMMCALASMERTETQWRDLLASVGLKVEEIMVHTPALYESVILAVLE